MELRQLRYFVEVARRRHFTRAAEALRVSQPSLSQQVRALERELGVDLLERTSRRVSLTPAGEALLARAERILAETEDAEAEMRTFTGVVQGRVKVGVLASFEELRVPAPLGGFNALYPRVEVEISEEDARGLMRLLKRGELDLALASQTGIEVPKGIVAEPLLEEDLVLVVAPGHRLAGRGSVGLRELEDEPFVLYRPGSGTRNQVVEACRGAGFEPRVAFESDAARALAAEGIGVAVVPRSTAELGGLELAVLGLVPPLKRGVAFFRNGERYPSPAVAALTEFGRRRLGASGR
jgi:LysR family transcriptional activator of glutamate synthase operon